MSSLGITDVDFGEHGVIYITSDKDRPPLTEWTNPATAELLRVLPKEFDLFSDGKIPSKRRMYENCATHLKKKGFNYTTAQTENKWKSLKRRYLTKYEKLLTGRPHKGPLKPKQLFDDEIEAILKIEKPSFKRDMDEITEINLNVPPGFSHKMEEDDEDAMEGEDEEEEGVEQYDDSEEHEYTQNDDKLVEMVLKGSQSMDEDNKSNVFANNIHYLFTNPEEVAEQSTEEKYLFRPSHPTDSGKLLKEINDLKKVVKRNLDTNSDIFKTQNSTHEQLLIYLDSLDKREEEKVELKRRKLEKQGELVQQIKIQNSLIAKLIQKLGNGGNGGNNR